jgi:hypothetical protein
MHGVLALPKRPNQPTLLGSVRSRELVELRQHPLGFFSWQVLPLQVLDETELGSNISIGGGDMRLATREVLFHERIVWGLFRHRPLIAFY